MITIVTDNAKKQKELAVETVLRGKGITYRLITLNDKAYTVDDVIRLAKEAVKPEEVCKTIVLRGKKTNAKVAIFLRGNDKVDFSAAKKYFGEEMAIATPEQVEEVAGVAPGAVCPFLLTVPLFLDQQVLSLANIHCGSGDHLVGLEFSTSDLQKVLSYQTVSLAKTL